MYRFLFIYTHIHPTTFTCLNLPTSTTTSTYLPRPTYFHTPTSSYLPPPTYPHLHTSQPPPASTYIHLPPPTFAYPHIPSSIHLPTFHLPTSTYQPPLTYLHLHTPTYLPPPTYLHQPPPTSTVGRGTVGLHVKEKDLLSKIKGGRHTTPEGGKNRSAEL